MLDARPSRTAQATAFLRALHVHIDSRPFVFDDRVAHKLLPAYQQRFIRRLEVLALPWLRIFRQRHDMLTAMRSQVVVRARYAEDTLADARREGSGRYIILSAGLDTFAVRQPEPKIAVVEIDHPATQRWKRELLDQIGAENPPDLKYLPIDFERAALTDAWVASPDPDFISWLGTTYYLSEEALGATLRALADNVTPGSRLVLDYWRELPAIDPDQALLWGTRAAVALQREPMQSFFEPPAIARLCDSCGWTVVEDLSADAQNERFLQGRDDRLAVPSFAHLLHLQR
jgi:methyltransferase (TIGR00027 family)